MKIAVTSQDGKIDGKLDPRFGRSKHFIVFDIESGKSELVDNSINLNAAQGAGIQAGRNVAELGVGAVITGNVGPKAFAVLNECGIKIYTAGDCSVKDAIEKYRNGDLKLVENANVQGHWA